MTRDDLVQEFTAQAEMCRALEATLPHGTPRDPSLSRAVAIARAVTWLQAADRVKRITSIGEDQK